MLRMARPLSRSRMAPLTVSCEPMVFHPANRQLAVGQARQLWGTTHHWLGPGERIDRERLWLVIIADMTIATKLDRSLIRTVVAGIGLHQIALQHDAAVAVGVGILDPRHGKLVAGRRTGGLFFRLARRDRGRLGRGRRDRGRLGRGRPDRGDAAAGGAAGFEVSAMSETLWPDDTVMPLAVCAWPWAL